MATNIVVSRQFNFPKNILIICNYIDIFKMSFFFLAHPVFPYDINVREKVPNW